MNEWAEPAGDHSPKSRTAIASVGSRPWPARASITSAAPSAPEPISERSTVAGASARAPSAAASSEPSGASAVTSAT